MSRIEAYSWLSKNWESAEPHAWRLVALCAKYDGDMTTAGNGASALPADAEEEVGRELGAANAILLTCRSDEVRLEIGSGAEDQIDFNAAYFYLPSLSGEELPCNEEAFDELGEGVCMARLADHWYIGIHWFARET